MSSVGQGDGTGKRLTGNVPTGAWGKWSLPAYNWRTNRCVLKLNDKQRSEYPRATRARLKQPAGYAASWHAHESPCVG